VNKTETRVEVRFDIDSATCLGPRQRARIGERLGRVVRVTVSDTRSQARNRELALERLQEKLKRALANEKKRKPTRRTRASKERRLDGKRKRAGVKKTRGSVGPDD
jgi:ribosome-associated protein